MAAKEERWKQTCGGRAYGHKNQNICLDGKPCAGYPGEVPKEARTGAWRRKAVGMGIFAVAEFFLLCAAAPECGGGANAGVL